MEAAVSRGGRAPNPDARPGPAVSAAGLLYGPQVGVGQGREGVRRVMDRPGYDGGLRRAGREVGWVAGRGAAGARGCPVRFGEREPAEPEDEVADVGDGRSGEAAGVGGDLLSAGALG